MLVSALLLLLGICAQPTPPPSTPPYNVQLTEANQELNYSRFGGLHRLSARVREVRGLSGNLHWVSANGQRLTAYCQGHRQWQALIGQTFRTRPPRACVTRLVLCSNTVFVDFKVRGHAELNRQRGCLQALGVAPN